MLKSFESEIIRQKKQFIFNVEQSSNYVFPNEEYTYLVYIKNVSGSEINNFYIKIEAPNNVFIESVKDKPNTPITLKNGESKLYEFKSSIETKGEYFVHFIGYGEETEIAHKNLKITCSRSYNSEKLIHRLHIYDFTPYEDNFSMEASNYSDEVVQTFKRQKLPYKSGEQPFPLVKSDNTENIESQSFLDQYNEAKNTKEHVYQYISRENFTEDSLENYEGENLYEIINKINTESEYFRATFLKTGTNILLNDFTQYKPNGLIYRLGLLSSEIYHTLGVIPTYSYMSDKLFRWAPSPSGQRIFHDRDIDEMDPTNDLLNLYPKPKSMKWGENIWAGRSWIVYKKPTEKYMLTDEFQKKFANKLISLKENIGSFENKKDAEKLVEVKEYFDEVVRNQIRDPLVKYKYEIHESLYDTGVFFVNIPIDKIPSNFYLIDTDDLYKIINRTKPYGVKPIINYVIERNFDLNLNYNVTPDYLKNIEFNVGTFNIKYRICENKFVKENRICDNEIIPIIRQVPVHCVLYNNDFDLDPQLKIDYSQVGIDFNKAEKFNTLTVEEETWQYHGTVDQKFGTINSILDLLYKNNYNNISFNVVSHPFAKVPQEIQKQFITKEQKTFLDENATKEVQAIKLPIYSKYNLPTQSIPRILSVKDSANGIHKFHVDYDQNNKLYRFKYIYQNIKGKEYIRKEGMQDIDGIIICIANYNRRKILIFMVEDTHEKIHYFYHTIVEDVTDFDSYTSDNQTINSIMYRENLLDEPIQFETPFYYPVEEYSVDIITGGDNWTNLYRLNDETTNYAYIQNTNHTPITPDSIYLHFDEIDVPDTAIIKNALILLNGNSSNKNIYLNKAIGQNYKVPNINGYSINLKPQLINQYSESNESNVFYKIKLDQAKSKEQQTLIDYYSKMIENNEIFDDDIDIDITNYMEKYQDYVTISKGFWNELSDITDLTNNLNEIKDISLIIEGYNEGYEVDMLSQVISGIDKSSTVTTLIPSGYFFLKVPLLYPNDFLLNLLRIRFRFYGLNHNIRIFNTTVDITFKNKQEEEQVFEFIEEDSIYNNKKVQIIEDYIFPQDLNNGLCLKISFDDLNSGEFYHLNSAKLIIVYQDTDVNLMINKNKYKYKPIGESQTTVTGKSIDTYLSGEFYNDVCSISQLESNVGIDNKGIELEDTLYQAFEAREDNITSIELFPNGFIGNPDETLKIGIYSNHENTPHKLIKEIYANGWTKNNEELKKLSSIKYNLNVDNLNVNETYWIKIQVLNPRDNSYYLLKSINRTQPRHKLLYMKNNNYINTFSSLTFNIYSKNISKSFGKLPAVQEFFDNPYILVGLHRGQGEIKNLLINKWDSTIKEDNHMRENINIEPEMILSKQNDDTIGIKVENTDGTILKANFEQNKWDKIE